MLGTGAHSNSLNEREDITVYGIATDELGSFPGEFLTTLIPPLLCLKGIQGVPYSLAHRDICVLMVLADDRARILGPTVSQY